MKQPLKLEGIGEFSARERMEINGSREAVVEGCCGILEYDSAAIRIRTPDHVIRFTGRELSIRCLTPDALVVTGRISGIEFIC